MTVSYTTRHYQWVTALYEEDGELMIGLENGDQDYKLLPGNYELRWKALEEGTEPYIVIQNNAYFADPSQSSAKNILPKIRVYDNGFASL